MVTVRLRHLRPQVLGTRVAAIAHVEGNDLAALGIHGDPDPLLVGLLLHKARHFIRFHLKALDYHVTVPSDGVDMEMVRQRLNTLDQKAQEPLETDTHGAANTPQGDPFAQQTLDQFPCLIRDAGLLRALHKLAWARLAMMILFTIMRTAILFEAG